MDSVNDGEALRERARGAQREASQSWPTVKTVDASAFERWFMERAASALPKHDTDLVLVFACLHGVEGAVAVFDSVARQAARGAVARIDPSAAFVDDVLQVLSEKLLVGSADRPPLLAEYEGRSSLRTWLATVAARTALNLRRAARDKPQEELRSGVAVIADGRAGPETEYAKEQHRREFHDALREAMSSLSERDRALLTQSIVEGASLEEIAARFEVSRATVARWLAAAREDLAARTQAELCRRLDVPAADYESVVAFVRSRLGESVVDALKGRR